MKTLAVINPRSAGGKTGRDAQDIARRLAEVTGPLSVAITSGPLDASLITSRALSASSRWAVTAPSTRS
jgi:diacylglycerol kinase family enzyme